MSSPNPAVVGSVPVFMPMACQVLVLSLWVFMGCEILITHRAEVNGLVAHADGVLVALRWLFVRMTFIYSPQHMPFELSELSLSSCVAKVWKPNFQHPQKLHSDLHALHTKTLQSWQTALTPFVTAVTGLISATLSCPIYFRL